MTTIKTVIRDRQVQAPAPEDLPDGTEVMLTIDPIADDGPVSPEEIARVQQAMKRFAEIDFMTEDEQSDDPEIVQQWIDDLRTIPPVPVNPEKEAEWRAWEEKMRQFNIEAVRKQFEEGTP